MGVVIGKKHVALAALGGTGVGVYALLVQGKLTVDTGIGRTVRPLGPLVWRIAAPRELVFEVISAPYLRRTPRALERKLRVLERGEDMVLAEHFTPVGPMVTTTLETVRFGTELEYRGEMGADLWAVGRAWGALVGRRWETAVRDSLTAIKAESERQAAHRRPSPVSESLNAAS